MESGDLEATWQCRGIGNEGVKKTIWLVLRTFFGEAKCIPTCEKSFMGLLVAKSLSGILEAGFLRTFNSSAR